MTTSETLTQPNSRPSGHAKSQPKPKNPAATALRPLTMDVAIPLGSYYLMRHFGVAVIPALALSSIVPAADSVIGLVKDRVVNGLALLMVAVNVVGIAVSFWSGDPRLMLAKEAAISSTIGIALLVSAVAGRPLMTAGLKPVLVKADMAKEAAFDRLQIQSPRFRRLERLFSAAWGAILVADCVARIICVFSLPVATMVWLSTVLTLGAVGVGMIVSGPFSAAMTKMVKLEAGR
jgi:hypothetical protein